MFAPTSEWCPSYKRDWIMPPVKLRRRSPQGKPAPVPVADEDPMLWPVETGYGSNTGQQDLNDVGARQEGSTEFDNLVEYGNRSRTSDDRRSSDGTTSFSSYSSYVSFHIEPNKAGIHTVYMVISY
jgi:hypothetical protein